MCVKEYIKERFFPQANEDIDYLQQFAIYVAWFTLFVFICCAHDSVDKYLAEMWVGPFLHNISEIVNKNNIANISLFILILLLFAFTIMYIYPRIASISRFAFWVFCIIYLKIKSQYWHYPNIDLYYFDFSYSSFLTAAAIILAIEELIMLFMSREKTVKKDNNNNQEERGYIIDKIKDKDKQETGWGKYIDEMLNLLPEGKLKNESLSIGIVGDWGSGKTTFLKEFSQHLAKDKYKTIMFEPWKCETPDQILQLFFGLLRSEFVHEPKFDAMFDQYYKLLIEADIHPGLNKVLEYISKKEETSYSALKEQINQKLSSYNKHIIITIDDLDRLEGEELLEVLRIIRVTADFNNVVYVVAYDKKYVSKMLYNKGIYNGELYLQKMFHLEISLPSLEKSLSEDIFINNLKNILPDSEEMTIDKIRSSVEHLFLGSDDVRFYHYIPNFRQNNRFSNVFALNLQMIKELSGNYSFVDFLCIEIIHFVYPELYDTLAHDVLSILCRRKDRLVYIKNENIDKDRKKSFLLKQLFPETSMSPSGNRICCVLNYANYFLYRIPKGEIMYTEFVSVLKADNFSDINKELDKWIYNNLYANSLFRRLKSHPFTPSKNYKDVVNYIYCILYLITNKEISSEAIMTIVKNKLKVNLKTQKNSLGKLKNFLCIFVKHIDSESSMYIYLNTSLSRLKFKNLNITKKM